MPPFEQAFSFFSSLHVHVRDRYYADIFQFLLVITNLARVRYPRRNLLVSSRHYNPKMKTCIPSQSSFSFFSSLHSPRLLSLVVVETFSFFSSLRRKVEICVASSTFQFLLVITKGGDIIFNVVDFQFLLVITVSVWRLPISKIFQFLLVITSARLERIVVRNLLVSSRHYDLSWTYSPPQQNFQFLLVIT